MKHIKTKKLEDKNTLKLISYKCELAPEGIIYQIKLFVPGGFTSLRMGRGFIPIQPPKIYPTNPLGFSREQLENVYNQIKSLREFERFQRDAKTPESLEKILRDQSTYNLP